MNPTTLLQWQAETQQRVKEAIKPNWRVWTWTQRDTNQHETKFMAWAEFGGTMGAGKIEDKFKRDVLLRARNGKEIRVPCKALSDADWEWARRGRIWKVTHPQSINIQYNLVEEVRGDIGVQAVGRTTVHTTPFVNLAPEDRTWIESLRSARERKYTSNEQIQDWLDFAPYIRK